MKARSLVLMLLFLVALPGHAESIAELVKQLKAVESNPASLEKAVAAGKGRALLCAYCHGEDGNSVKGYIPNLAAQNAEYLLTQFEYFADGTRKDFVMSDLAKNLSDEERINIILFFSRNAVKKVASTDDGAFKRGEKLYQSYCHACHGVDAHGNAGLPRLAGQPKEYLSKTLKAFLAGEGNRKNSLMVGIVAKYKAHELEDVAEYLSAID